MLISKEESKTFSAWYVKLKSKNGIKNQTKKSTEREGWIKDNPCPIESKLIELYESGYGYKTLVKDLDVSYSVLRHLFIRYFDITPRHGQNVVTDKLRKIRSDNVIAAETWIDWPKKYPHMLEKNGRSIQGYYKKKDGSFVWLRSSYEYIYAKFLDKRNVNWKVEAQAFDLSNGEKYRPDFFIYENDKLIKIVEIKSRYFNKGNREYKYDLFNNEYDIPCEIITDIETITESSNYFKELKKWKEVKISSAEKLVLQE